MYMKNILLICLAMVTLTGCKPSANAPYLPPISTAPTMSGPEAAINNSSIVDNEKAAAQGNN